MEFLLLRMILIVIILYLVNQLNCILRYSMIKVQAKKKVELNKIDRKVKSKQKKREIGQSTWIL
jgi:hypothetical protein